MIKLSKHILDEISFIQHVTTTGLGRQKSKILDGNHTQVADAVTCDQALYFLGEGGGGGGRGREREGIK